MLVLVSHRQVPNCQVTHPRKPMQRKEQLQIRKTENLSSRKETLDMSQAVFGQISTKRTKTTPLSWRQQQLHRLLRHPITQTIYNFTRASCLASVPHPQTSASSILRKARPSSSGRCFWRAWILCSRSFMCLSPNAKCYVLARI